MIDPLVRWYVDNDMVEFQFPTFNNIIRISYPNINEVWLLIMDNIPIKSQKYDLYIQRDVLNSLICSLREKGVWYD